MKKIVLILSLIILIIIFYIIYCLNYIPKRKYSNEYFNIISYKSNVDKNENGIDDQTDILIGVKEYIKTKPKYKSKYYEKGYSNDSYGVCTDVVAMGLFYAGYDLRELVNQDILANKELYNIDKIDKNIDFRRVRNLKIYFKRNTINLTTNISKIDEWQGGDIVIFDNHIGVISDNRNSKGIPYVIHQANIYQKDYEEDILDSNFYKIVGHYRIS